MVAGGSVGLGGLFLAFAKIGAVLFGSGYVLLAFLRSDLVELHQWLTEQQLLDAIAVAEGTRGHGHDGYNVTFAYRYFSSCKKHPNMKVCSGAYCSTAAGRYQFLTATWKGLGYSNFGPANQDKGAMKLVARRGAKVPTGRSMTATEFANTMNRISWEWASLPPGRYGQPSRTMKQMRSTYCSFAGC